MQISSSFTEVHFKAEARSNHLKHQANTKLLPKTLKIFISQEKRAHKDFESFIIVTKIGLHIMAEILNSLQLLVCCCFD